MPFYLNIRVKNAQERVAKFIDELADKHKAEIAAEFKEAKRANTERWDAAERELTGKVKKKLKPSLKSKVETIPLTDAQREMLTAKNVKSIPGRAA